MDLSIIIIWIIGFILSSLGIWTLKNSRTREVKNYRGDLIIPREPVLKLWSLVLLVIASLIPVMNIFVGFVIIYICVCNVYNYKDWEFVKSSSRFIKFLNKPIG